jgi:molecular chaperone HtpG
VDLYCKKVLIDPGCKGLLPEWLRFLKGVVDSEDLPLNISRESMQDSALLQKLNQVVTKRFLKTLEGEAKNSPEKYDEFYERFSRFLKEGVAVDFAHRDQLAKLLRFESSFTEKGKVTSLADYVGRAKEGQEEIYYQIGQSRDAIESGPYLEAFQERGIEVLYLFEGIDEYVMTNLTEFDGKSLMAVERADVKLDEVTPDESEEKEEALPEADSTTLCEFMKEALGERVEKVEASTRLKDSPALVLLPEGAASPQMRQMMRALKPDEAAPISVNLEVNPRHALVKKLAVAQEANPELAKLISAQILDNAMLSAGLLEESKDMVARVYEIMGAALPEEEK